MKTFGYRTARSRVFPASSFTLTRQSTRPNVAPMSGSSEDSASGPRSITQQAGAEVPRLGPCGRTLERSALKEAVRKDPDLWDSSYVKLSGRSKPRHREGRVGAVSAAGNGNACSGGCVSLGVRIFREVVALANPADR